MFMMRDVWIAHKTPVIRGTAAGAKEKANLLANKG